MTQRFSLAAAAIAIAAASPVAAKFTPPPMPAGYDDPGPKPADVLPPLVKRLKLQLYDPYSVRDLIVCKPIQTQPFAPTYKGSVWRPASWMVSFALNGRNRLGGYVGQSDGTAHIRNGEVVEMRLTERRPPEHDYEVTLADFNLKMLEHCDHIPDADYQRTLGDAR